MFNKFNTFCFACLPLIFFSFQCKAADLSEVYSMALSSDPQYRQAQAAFQATLEVKPQARALLLPDVSLSANTATNDQDIDTASIGASGEVDFNTHGYSLDLRQPIFHYDRFLSLSQADSQIQQAQAELDFAHQDLIIRVAERYFNVLAAMDNLEFVRGEKKSLERQLEQANQRFEVGLTAITDVQEAQAGYDRAVANEISAENLLDNTREALRELTGEYIELLSPLGEEMALVEPTPNEIDTWTDISREQNLQVIATKYFLETTRTEINIQRSGHLPTVDLVANHGFNSTGGRFGGTDVDFTAIGLELNVPIYEGGAVNSRVRESEHRYTEAMQRLEQQYRAAQRETREAYLGVISGISEVKALKQALISTETALQATQAGFEVGTRTAVDVVASERATLEAKRDYARARYNYIGDSLRLKQAAGTLSPDDVDKINNWLK